MGISKVTLWYNIIIITLILLIKYIYSFVIITINLKSVLSTIRFIVFMLVVIRKSWQNLFMHKNYLSNIKKYIIKSVN